MEAIAEYISNEVSQDFEENIPSIISNYKEEIEFQELLNKSDSRFVLAKNKIPERLLDIFYEKIDKEYICITQQVSQNFMRKHKDTLNWKYLCIYNTNFTEEFIIEMEKYIFWNELFSHQNDLSDNIINNYKSRVKWARLECMKENVLRKCWDFLNKKRRFEIISYLIDDKISIDFIREYKDKLGDIWYCISFSDILLGHEEEFKDYIEWERYIFSNFKNLSIDTMVKYGRRVNVNMIINNCQVTEEFINAFINKDIDWVELYHKQYNLSEEFLVKHSTKVHRRVFLSNPGLPIHIIKKFRDEVNWSNIVFVRAGDKEFLDEFKEDIKMIYIPDNVITLEMVDACKDKSFLKKYFYGNTGKTLDSDSILWEECKKIIRKYPNMVDWNDIFHSYDLDIDFMEEMKKYISWKNIKKRIEKKFLN